MNNFEWNNKVVIVTGASSGIGREISSQLAVLGARVFAVARRLDRLEALATAPGVGGRVTPIQADVTLSSDMQRVVEQATQVFGRVDALIANAGYGVSGFAKDLRVSDYRAQFETNVFGVLEGFYAALPELMRVDGRFAVVGSVSAYTSLPTVIPYSMSKYAVRAFAEGLHSELSVTGVSCTLINPGFVESDIRKVNGVDPIPMALQMPTVIAARKIIGAIGARKRELNLTWLGKATIWLSRYFPALLLWGFKQSVKKPERLLPPAH